jgi:uncharacterized membrane protein YtjA (UPF0391 family)
MLNWVLTFLVAAIVVAIFGFSGIAGTAIDITKTIFFIFVVLLVISLIANAVRGKLPKI